VNGASVSIAEGLASPKRISPQFLVIGHQVPFPPVVGRRARGSPRSCRVPNSRKRTLMPHHSSLTT